MSSHLINFRVAMLLGWTLTLTAPAKAATIEAPFTGFFQTGFGSGGSAYVGNTFTAIAGEPESLTFALLGTSRPLNFRLLITEFDLVGSFLPFHPTTVLFESATLVNPSGFAVTEHTIDLDGLSLVEGHEYAWLLDAFVEPNVDHVDVATAINVTNAYLGGNLVLFPPDPVLSGTRADHFANNWLIDEAADFSFRMTFSPVSVPEPETLTMLALGLIGLACYGRQRASLAR